MEDRGISDCIQFILYTMKEGYNQFFLLIPRLRMQHGSCPRVHQLAISWEVVPFLAILWHC